MWGKEQASMKSGNMENIGKFFTIIQATMTMIK